MILVGLTCTLWRDTVEAPMPAVPRVGDLMQVEERDESHTEYRVIEVTWFVERRPADQAPPEVELEPWAKFTDVMVRLEPVAFSHSA